MRKCAFGIVLILLGLAACSTPGPAPKQSEYPVTLAFDGGYALISDEENKTLTVAAFDDGHEPSGPGAMSSRMAAHKMRLRLDIGKPISAPASLKFFENDTDTWALDEDRFDITIGSYGETPAGVIEPPSTEPHPDAPCSSKTPKNNLALLPAMDVLASKGDFDGTLVTDRNRFENQVILTAGTVSVFDLTSCMEFKTGGKAVRKHRVPTGLGGIHVDFKMKGNLKLLLKNPKGQVIEMEFAPDTTGLGDPALKLWFGRFPPDCAPSDPGCFYTKGQQITDFDRFYSLLKTPPPASKRVMPYNAAESDEVCPGSQCPSMRFLLRRK